MSSDNAETPTVHISRELENALDRVVRAYIEFELENWELEDKYDYMKRLSKKLWADGDNLVPRREFCNHVFVEEEMLDESVEEVMNLLGYDVSLVVDEICAEYRYEYEKQE